MTSKLHLSLTLLLLLVFNLTQSQEKKAFYLYTQEGEKISYDSMLDSLSKTNVVLFGEFHNNPISHWLQFEVVSDLKTSKTNLAIGAEMFETDTQAVLNLYLKDSLTEPKFKKEARVWSNYSTDYRPLVELAKRDSIPYIATNIPRPYATRVYKNGGFSALDSLPKNELKWIAPLPIPFDINLSSYQNMLDMMGGHGGEDLVKAQAIKDATMAHFILENLKPNQVFVHLNGSYHSNSFEGIYWYLKTYRENLNILTLTTVEQKNVHQLKEEHKGLANFIIVVDENMTKTY
ncbi:ChaN family lipoprotein [Psychroflexus gondwanensis]|uniref:ChaN family lipoprotein n=1 Tax=Psychroflexus gondwanensis TaxID=251 RepID=UPI0011BDC021|nr:ChaN family lipoprotein [Psychroflexus gondwanensis]TXE17171.1 ChaN family lipoprotein [Psychroflexus gondwanensis]